MTTCRDGARARRGLISNSAFGFSIRVSSRRPTKWRASSVSPETLRAWYPRQPNGHLCSSHLNTGVISMTMDGISLTRADISLDAEMIFRVIEAISLVVKNILRVKEIASMTLEIISRIVEIISMTIEMAGFSFSPTRRRRHLPCQKRLNTL